MGKAVDLTGRVFGRLTALTLAGHVGEGRAKARTWLCICECGNEAVVRAASLANGNTKSCGCSFEEMQAKHSDLIGQRFGRLTVVAFYGVVDRYGKKKRIWSCECDCGQKTNLATSQLTATYKKSCGCIRREQTIRNFTTHGHAGKGRQSTEYKIWSGMLKRCKNTNDIRYGDYGGRGITVCQRWADNFENFFQDMGPRPKKFTIERVKNNGNYEPNNCVWAPQSVQNKNQRQLKSNTSGVTGVTLHRATGKWLVRIGHEGKRLHIGLFATIEEAAAARIKVMAQYNYNPNHGCRS